MSDNDQDCAQKVWTVLPTLMRAIAAQWRQQEPRLDLTMWQIKALNCLRGNAPTVGDLAREFLVAAPTVTRLLDNLVERGLVERREDPRDRRLVRLSLTGKGEEILQEFERLALRCVEEIMAGLGAEEKRQVAGAMDLLQVTLQRLPQAEHRRASHG